LGLYLVRRVGLAVLTVLGVTLLTFLISHVVPGDPARLAAGPDATASSIAAIRQQMGLNLPLPVQYGHYLDGLVHLNLGRSIVTQDSVGSDLSNYFPATLELVIAAFAIYLLVGIPLGVLAALTRGRWPDAAVRLGTSVLYAVPLFLTALWLQYFFTYHWRLLPQGNELPPFTNPPTRITGMYVLDSLLTGNWSLLGTSVRYLILPALSLALGLLAIAARFTRASMLTELDKDYVKMAYLKGLSKARVIVKHALRNSLIPVVTMTGVQFGYFIGGTVLVETVYGWPGIGLYSYNAITSLDYAPILGVTLVSSVFFVAANLAVDLLYPVLDPRISLLKGR
jgi:peptide/nickel transport system permease protein